MVRVLVYGKDGSVTHVITNPTRTYVFPLAGDVTPIQISEKIVAMVGMLVGVTIFAYDSDSPGSGRVGV